MLCHTRFGVWRAVGICQVVLQGLGMGVVSFPGCRRGSGRIGCAGLSLPLFHLGWRIFPENVLSALGYPTFFKIIFLGRNYKPFVRSHIGSCQVVPPMKAAFRRHGILEMCSLDHEKGAAFHTNFW